MTNYTVTYADVGLSTLRWLMGLSSGVAVGAFLAILSYLLRAWFAPARLLLQMARALPILGLLPLVQFAFGVGEPGKLLLIGIASAFPVYFACNNALLTREVDQLLFFDALRLGRGERFVIDVWPRLRRGLIEGVEISIGLAWITVVAAESIGTLNQGFWAGGLGYRLFTAFDVNRITSGLIALMFFGFMGLLTGEAWAWLRRRHGY